MSVGYVPCGPDGRQVNFHHILGRAGNDCVTYGLDAPRFSRQLHRLIERGRSFRNSSELKRSYTKFRWDWWGKRASDVER
ncbi:HNH/ENDO VII family nuclease [Bordetella sp. LUAb4]|uniref:HNH/ENDO VII family nuclease n=1 Tax=Bordetella sp. LUAb4 TaxID=2843195 RepID=UPI00351D0C0B